MRGGMELYSSLALADTIVTWASVSPWRGCPFLGHTEAQVTIVSAKAKELYNSMPPRKHIPDDASYTIKDDAGATLAIYCCHCGRFTKGRSAHATKDHKGRFLTPYAGPPPAAPAPAPAPAPTVGGNLATFPTEIDPSSVPVVDNDAYLLAKFAKDDDALI